MQERWDDQRQADLVNGRARGDLDIPNAGVRSKVIEI